jgi:hypothetical protein
MLLFDLNFGMSNARVSLSKSHFHTNRHIYDCFVERDCLGGGSETPTFQEVKNQ